MTKELYSVEAMPMMASLLPVKDDAWITVNSNPFGSR